MNLHRRCEWVGDGLLYRTRNTRFSDRLCHCRHGRSHRLPSIPATESAALPLSNRISENHKSAGHVRMQAMGLDHTQTTDCSQQPQPVA